MEQGAEELTTVVDTSDLRTSGGEAYLREDLRRTRPSGVGRDRGADRRGNGSERRANFDFKAPIIVFVAIARTIVDRQLAQERLGGTDRLAPSAYISVLHAYWKTELPDADLRN
uniref:Transposase n=1 Tax=Steinernema glaseri TaxID=37863 RepID=A0A1I8AJV4_9BILA